MEQGYFVYDNSLVQPVDPLKDFALQTGGPVYIGPAAPPVDIPDDSGGPLVFNTGGNGLEEVPTVVPTTSPTTTPLNVVQSNPIIGAGLLLVSLYLLGAFKKNKR
jgi:hypothetical protein